MISKPDFANYEEIKKIDREGMYELIYDFPHQLTEGMHLGKNADLKYPRLYPGNIVLAGMGGSAIGGDLIRSYLSYELKVPFFVCRNYILPDFINDKSLVFVSSYSGNTEETLSAYKHAKNKNAKIIVVTSGGKLIRECKKDGFPFVAIPKGLPPRAALGYSFTPVLIILSRLGIVSDRTEELEIISRDLIKNRRKYSLKKSGKRIKQNPAKYLALKLHKKIPIIYSSVDYFDAVAYRWKGQFCENSKILAFNNCFPEFNHNELVGWHILRHIRDKLIVVLLKDRKDHPQIKRRMAIVKSIIEKEKVGVIEIKSQGRTLLSRIFHLIQLGDFTSYYLAILNRVDPTPVKVIDYLKKRLNTLKM